jgi:hypothetical protein
MAENITIFPTGLTYSRNTKAPLMDMQVFKTLALAQAYVDNKDQTAYVGLTVSVTDDGSNNGLYYVERIADANNATGLLVKVGSDASAAVADLQADVAALKTAVGDETSGLVADVAKNAGDIATNAENIEKKADKFTVGNGLSYSENKIDVVVSTAEGNSLTVDENGLYVAVPEIEVPEYALVSVENPEDGYASQYQFKKDGEVLNTINIPKDQFLKSASYNDVSNKLVFVFNTATGESTTEVDVNDLVDTYTAGDYITITDSVIAVNYESLKAKINTDLVASVASAVENVAGRMDTAEGKISTLETASDDYADRIGVLETDNGDHEDRIATLEAVTHPTLEQVTTLENNYTTLNTNVTNISNSVAEIKVKDVDTTASNGVALKLDAAGKVGVSVDIDAIADVVIGKHVVEFDADTIKTTSKIGPNEDGASVQTVLENLDSRITAAVSGGVTSVAAGNGIAVDTTDANNPKVSVNVAPGSALKATADGLTMVWEELV